MAGEKLKHDARPNDSALLDAATLIDACSRGDEGTVREILSSNPSSATAAARDGFEPLHFAVREGHERVVQLLLQHDAEPHSVTQSIWGHRLSTVDIAKARGYDGVVRLVEEAVRRKHRLALAEDPLRRALKENDLGGIKRELAKDHSLVNTIDEDGNTPKAIWKGFERSWPKTPARLIFRHRAKNGRCRAPLNSGTATSSSCF
jgi:ankyrin repeat protein